MGKDSVRIEVLPGLDIVEKEGSFAVTADRQIRITVVGRYMQIHCHGGFCIVADLALLPRDISEVISCVNIDVGALANKFKKDNGGFRLTTDDRVERVLSEIERAMVEDRTVLTKLKTLELLVKLEEVDTERGNFFPADCRCTPKQAVVARSVHSYMMLHMDRHITVDMLAEKFQLSKTQIKDSFRLYFGESIFRFIRNEKMLVAANMLRHTEKSIEMIASHCGYESASKFSRAFAEVMQSRPREYRNNILDEEI